MLDQGTEQHLNKDFTAKTLSEKVRLIQARAWLAGFIFAHASSNKPMMDEVWGDDTNEPDCSDRTPRELKQHCT